MSSFRYHVGTFRTPRSLSTFRLCFFVRAMRCLSAACGIAAIPGKVACVFSTKQQHMAYTHSRNSEAIFFLPTIHTVVASFLGPRSCSVFITRRRAGFWRLACTAGMPVAVLGNVSSP